MDFYAVDFIPCHFLFHKHLFIRQYMDLVLGKQKWKIDDKLTVMLGKLQPNKCEVSFNKTSEGHVPLSGYQLRLPAVLELSLKKAGGINLVEIWKLEVVYLFIQTWRQKQCKSIKRVFKKLDINEILRSFPENLLFFFFKSMMLVVFKVVSFKKRDNLEAVSCCLKNCTESILETGTNNTISFPFRSNRSTDFKSYI